MQIELCSFSSSSLVKAPVCPALRIELCSNFYEGGTTPSIFSFLKVIETLPNPVFVMIRPRGGDFLYTDEEFEEENESLSRVVSFPLINLTVNLLLVPSCRGDWSIKTSRLSATNIVCSYSASFRADIAV